MGKLSKDQICMIVGISIMSLIVGVPFIAGLTMPIIRMRALTGSLQNAKMLGLACKQYAIDNKGNYPASLDLLVPKYLPSRESLASPLEPGKSNGYTYHPGLKDTSPPDAILIEDKFAPKAMHDNIVIYADDSGRIIPIQ